MTCATTRDDGSRDRGRDRDGDDDVAKVQCEKKLLNCLFSD